MEHFLHSVSKASKKLQKRLKKFVSKNPKILPLLLIVFGLIVFIFGGINYYKVRILSFSSVPKGAITKTKNADIPVEIIIPSIQIDLKVDPAEIKDGVWQISESNATYLNSSAPPGSAGNTVIYGHNKKAVFGNLPYLSIGQKIIIKTKSGKIYNYIAKEKYFVSPDRVDLISPSNKEELTIYTCWDFFDSQRAVIKATLAP